MSEFIASVFDVSSPWTIPHVVTSQKIDINNAVSVETPTQYTRQTRLVWKTNRCLLQ